MAVWTAGALSSSANWMLSMSIPVLVYEMTGSNEMLGTAAVAANLPSLLGSPLGGAWADRYSKRVVLLFALAAQILFTSLLFHVSRGELLSIPLLLGLTVANGFASSINLSAYQALVADIVPPRMLRPAYKLNAVQFNLSRAVGPAVAGVVLATWGASTAFLVNAFAHLPLMVVLFVISTPARPREAAQHLLTEISLAAKVTWADDSLRRALITICITSGFGMSIQSLGKGLTEEVFHVGNRELGLMIGTIGLSAVVTAIGTAFMGERVRGSHLVRVGLVLYGIGLLIVAATNVFWVGLVGFAITGFAHVLVNVSVTTAIQAHVSDAFRGRVTSLQLMGIILSMAAGAQLGGAIGDSFGLPAVLALYGSVLVGYAAFAHWQMDGLRGLD